MITEKCNSLSDSVTKLHELRSVDQHKQTLENCKRGLQDASLALKTDDNIINLFKSFKLIKNSVDIDTTKEMGQLKTIEDKFRESPLAITEGRNFNTLLNQLENIHKKYEQIIGKIWQNWIGDELQNMIESNTLQLFENLPKFRKIVKGIKESQKVLFEQSKKFPQREVDIENVLMEIRNIKELTDSLPLEKFPEDVQKFLRTASSSDGSSLDTLTYEVIEWLKENDLYEHYSIKPKFSGAFS